MNDGSSTRLVPEQGAQVSRRTLLSWLGNATVLALTPDLLGGCEAAGDPRGTAGTDPGPAEGGSGGEPGVAGSAGNAGATPAFPFAPAAAEGDLYATWQGNTVDPQDLAAILASWTLVIDGLVERERVLSFADLLRLPRQDQVTDFHCVEGWSVLDVPWHGVHADSLIELARPDPAATHVTLSCVRDVYAESLPLEVAREPHTLFAYGINGSTLPLTHGFPLRLVVPRLFGYKSAKWVQRITFAAAAEQGFWEQRGFPYDAEVPATRLREGKY